MPSILPGYEYDIFISYRQKDNQYDGWVTEFVENLSKELEATFKEDVSIYFDENPHNGLLETHNVGKSLEGKLKCLVFIPIISQTYCDPKSFAWEHEFVAFNKIASNDQLGKTVTLATGNIAERILPVQIHDIDPDDTALYELTTNDVLRPVDFIYRLPGVNRQLRAIDDDQIKGPEQILYRDQINKVAHAIKDIITGLKNTQFSEEAKARVVESPHEKVPIRETQIKEKEVSPEPKRRSKLILYAIPIILLIILAVLYVPNWLNARKAKNELLPAIQKLVDDNFRAPTEAFDLALEAEKYLPNDSSLIKLWPSISRSVSMETEPAGAEVFWKDYDAPDEPWRFAGTTPFKDIRFPRGYIRMEIRKEGYQKIEYSGPWAYGGLGPDIAKLKLDPIDSLPENMVRIPASETRMFIVGLENQGPKDVNEFLIDRFEVTNADYKKFMEDEGYRNENYWQYPIYSDGIEISLDSALKLFVDKTSRQGPATWEAGTFPSGMGNHPVTGVSWYEAAAFAAYSHKQLPSIFHWAVVAATSRTEFIVPLSNFDGLGTTTVGSNAGYSKFGIYDLAGNAREWCFNEGLGRARFMMGGGWSDPVYSFNDAYHQPPLDRSQTNGFRCIRLFPEDSSIVDLDYTVAMAFRDYKKEKPVNDETFKIMLRQYAYDKTALEIKIESTLEGELWTAEKITLNTGYNNERMDLYIYIPKNTKPPYQPILFFPGSGDIHRRKYYPERIGDIDFIIKSGRALIRPIYKGTLERFDDLKSDLPDESVFYKDHVIMWRKDIGRTIDYLESRDDINSDKLGFLGWSWGGYMGGIMPAIETRIKAVVLNVGGMVMNTSLPEADQLNFLPRVTQPVLMLNGKHDMFFPVETSQKPMFNFLGTPKAHKKMIVYESGHLVPKTEFIKETLIWYDKYLGPVK